MKKLMYVLMHPATGYIFCGVLLEAALVALDDKSYTIAAICLFGATLNFYNARTGMQALLKVVAQAFVVHVAEEFKQWPTKSN